MIQVILVVVLGALTILSNIGIILIEQEDDNKDDANSNTNDYVTSVLKTVVLGSIPVLFIIFIVVSIYYVYNKYCAEQKKNQESADSIINTIELTQIPKMSISIGHHLLSSGSIINLDREERKAMSDNTSSPINQNNQNTQNTQIIQNNLNYANYPNFGQDKNANVACAVECETQYEFLID